MSDLIQRLRKRAEIRRSIPTRKSVQEGKPDRLADLLDEAATELQNTLEEFKQLQADYKELKNDYNDTVRRLREIYQ